MFKKARALNLDRLSSCHDPLNRQKGSYLHSIRFALGLAAFFSNCCCLLSYDYPSQQLQLYCYQQQLQLHCYQQLQLGLQEHSRRKFCSLRHQLFQSYKSNLPKSMLLLELKG